MGTLIKTLLVTGIFVLGAIIGWYVRDYDGYKRAESKPVTSKAPIEAPALGRLAQLQKLLDANRYEEAVKGMHDL